MAFCLKPAPTFASDVRLTIPGQPSPGVLTITWRHKGRKEAEAWVKGAAGRKDPEILGEVIAGWSGVTDDQGQDVPFTCEALESLCNDFPAAGMELFDAYLAALSESRAKNSV